MAGRKDTTMLPFTASLLALLALTLPACGSSTYCQSGPKHGTQCYDVDESQQSNNPADPPPDHHQQQLAPH
jgi:hypothetical protein